MSRSLNKVILIGRLGADPEVRSFQSGGKVCNLSVATEESWKNKDTGERQSKTEWHRVTIFAEPTVRYAEQYLGKGDLVYIEGKLETRKWQDQSGADRYSTEVVVRPYVGQVMGLSGGDGAGRSAGRPKAEDDGAGYGAGAGGRPGDGGSGGGFGDMDDEIPFGPEVRV